MVLVPMVLVLLMVVEAVVVLYPAAGWWSTCTPTLCQPSQNGIRETWLPDIF